ncbi:MAG: AAA family ATPase [Myxococcota bacterium]
MATAASTRSDAAAPRATLEALTGQLHAVVRGKPRAVELLLVGVLAGGHVLIEDVPGVGKTTLAKALARASDVAFKRVQFTPDLLPSDILGTEILNPKEGTIEFHRGPVFTNVLLADEINRASPRTQSALLEAMNEGQVTIEGRRHPLPDPFFVVATQNPVDFEGTYPLPEAQLDQSSCGSPSVTPTRRASCRSWSTATAGIPSTTSPRRSTPTRSGPFKRR